jgi:hypothetical protein
MLDNKIISITINLGLNYNYNRAILLNVEMYKDGGF